MSHKPVKKVIPVVLLVVLGLLVWMMMKKSAFYYAGTIEATEVTLSARVTSVIDSKAVKEGEEVKKAQTLMMLSGEDIRLNADNAAAEHRRGEKLFKGGSLAASDYEKLVFQRDRTAMLMDWCNIKSPVNGVVLHIYREPGELVSPGMPLMTIGDLSEVWAMIYVEQPMLVHLKPGQKVKAMLPELPETILEGNIAVIRDKAEFTPKNVQTRKERSRLVYGIKVILKNPERLLKPGMTVEVDFSDTKK